VSARLPQAVNRLPMRVRLAVAIERLPEAHRLVLALRLLDELSTPEAAGAMKLSARDVESRFAAALDVLADELGVPVRRAA
jgi:DNA-directed RNA polymerase specialized sigma24 family protein